MALRALALILLIAAPALAGAATGPSSSQPEAPPGGASPAAEADGRVAALLAALEAYEASIECVAWKQRSYTPPSHDLKRETWVLLEESERYVDSRWRWLHLSRHIAVTAPEAAPTYPESLYFGDGLRRFAWGRERNSGVVTAPDAFSAGGCHLWRVLGGAIDYDDYVRGRPPSVILRGAPRLMYLEPTAEFPWPGIRGEEVFDRVWADMEVRLDPEHGLAPRMFRTFQHNTGALSETLVVIEYQQVDGVWLPRIGVGGINYSSPVRDVEAPLPQVRALDFERIRSMEGLPEPLRSPAVAAWIERLLEITVVDAANSVVNGPLVSFRTEETMVSPQLFIVDEISVNDAMGDGEMFDRVPGDVEIFDDVIGRPATWQATRGTYLDLVERAEGGDAVSGVPAEKRP